MASFWSIHAERLEHSAVQTVPSPYLEILNRARLQPGATAVSTGGHDISYGQFAREIEYATRTLVRENIPPGTRVSVNVWPSYYHWLILLAAWRLGLPTVTSGGSEAKIIRPGLSIEVNPEVSGPGERTLHFSRPAWLGEEAAALPRFQDQPLADEATCLFVLSSGTTGNSKAVMLSNGALRRRYMENNTRYGINGDTRLLSMMTPRAIGGVVAPICTWYSGGAVVLEDGDKKLRGTQQIIRHRPNMLLASPAQLAAVESFWPRGRPPQPDLVTITGGSVLPPKVSEQFRKRVSARLSIWYGSTECSLGARGDAAHAEGRPGYVGFTPPFTELQIVDDDGRALPVGETGRVRMRAADMSHGYFDDPETTAAAFIDGWFYPGDLAVQDDEGGLTIIGRSTEVINLGGVKLAPDRIDEVLLTQPGVKDLAAFGVRTEKSEQLWLAVVAGEGFDLNGLTLEYMRIFKNLGKPLVLLLKEIPRNEMGKVLRADLQTIVKEGQRTGRLQRQ